MQNTICNLSKEADSGYAIVKVVLVVGVWLLECCGCSGFGSYKSGACGSFWFCGSGKSGKSDSVNCIFYLFYS